MHDWWILNKKSILSSDSKEEDLSNLYLASNVTLAETKKRFSEGK